MSHFILLVAFHFVSQELGDVEADMVMCYLGGIKSVRVLLISLYLLEKLLQHHLFNC
jgi:hypothetical protein